MTGEAHNPEELTDAGLSELIINMIHQTLVHHTLYFMEVQHQFGMEKALEIMNDAWVKSYQAQMKRISRALGFDMEGMLPKPLADLPREQKLKLIGSLGANWLAGDGIWFQTVEKHLSVMDAQRCAGSCIIKYSAFEAYTIKKFLGLPELAGLEGLKQALRFRPYHQINVQSIVDESPNSVVFQMNECIVQTTRNQKGLEDYPCKSTGIGEYRSFASTIDRRIVTECIGCPPDQHPGEWYCAWRFTISDE